MESLFQWQFIEVLSAAGNYWIWQYMALDGTISQRCCNEFGDYGAALYDAILNAHFRPNLEGWSIITSLTVSHCNPMREDSKTLEPPLHQGYKH